MQLNVEKLQKSRNFCNFDFLGSFDQFQKFQISPEIHDTNHKEFQMK